MKKVTVFLGTARRQHTYYAVQQFLEELQKLSSVKSEIVPLTDYRIESCRGCKNCFRAGEGHCPLKDDRDALIGKMMESNGVVFATPNYSYQVSSVMKAFLDRLGFLFHRPRFFGRTCTSIVAQGIYGGSKIVKYLDFVGMGLGFNVVRGNCTTALDPMNRQERERIDAVASEHGRRFHAGLSMPPYPVPALLKVCAFRAARTSIRVMLDENSCDFAYYRDQGWFCSDYYYPVRLGPAKRMAGRFVDWCAARAAGAREE